MPRKTQPTPARTRTRSRSRKVDPTGRVDVLASRCLAQVAQRNPLLAALHQEMAPDLDRLLTQYLGPRNRKLAMVARVLKATANANANANASRNPRPSTITPRPMLALPMRAAQ